MIYSDNVPTLGNDIKSIGTYERNGVTLVRNSVGRMAENIQEKKVQVGLILTKFHFNKPQKLTVSHTTIPFALRAFRVRN